MTEIGVAEAARWLNVSQQRVRVLISTGALPARQVSGVWLVDTTRPWQVHRLSRPLSRRTAEALILALSNQPVGDLPRSQAARLEGYINRLSEHADPGRLLASWVAARPSAQPLALSARLVDLQGILADPQFVPSGISDPRSGLGGGGEVEGWISKELFEPFTWRHMLSTLGKPNVFLRLSSTPMERPVPVGVLLTDLASWPGDREQEAVARLLRSHRA